MSAPDDARHERYTHGHHESVLRSHSWRTIDNSAAYLAPHLLAGHRVLDVGCGPGTVTAELADRVGPEGSVVGVDTSAEVIALASRRQSRPNASYEVGDVYWLDAADDSFDVVHAHQLLQHVADPVAALREMRRVCRPGGLVAVRDADYTGSGWFPDDALLDEWLSLSLALGRANGGEPDAGRRLLSWARAAGFADVTPSASVWCFATPSERAWWAELWADRVTQSAFAEQSVSEGRATSDELAAIADAWRRWASDDSAWFAVLHGEILARA
ncbi:MAG: methyltransferase domain-containing protein [Actinomycetota bacterium]|nr:methyltransferase domain-containing protein [Actinomycetota bacterium]MDH5278093.1 methyltransferase domain-containing protein [Actinomycetota bacterium]